jgi:hypothetical protein
MSLTGEDSTYPGFDAVGFSTVFDGIEASSVDAVKREIKRFDIQIDDAKKLAQRACIASNKLILELRKDPVVIDKKLPDVDPSCLLNSIRSVDAAVSALQEPAKLISTYGTDTDQNAIIYAEAEKFAEYRVKQLSALSELKSMDMTNRVLIFYQMTMMSSHKLRTTAAAQSELKAWLAKSNISKAILVFITTSKGFDKFDTTYESIGLSHSALRTLPRPLNRLHWLVYPSNIVSRSGVSYNKLKC